MNILKNKTILAIAIFLSFVFNNAIAASDKGEAQAQTPATLVEVSQTKALVFAKKITITGTLRASQGVTIRPEVAGRITDIYFKSGTLVAAGTPLIQLNKDIVQAELQQSQAELELAKQNYDRMKNLFQSRTISKADFDDVASKLNVAIAKVAEYQAELKQTLILAPFSGKLGLSAVSIGDYLNIGQDIVSLQALNPIEVEFNVPEVYLSKIAIGQLITINSDAYLNQNFYGKIYAIDALVNVNNRTFGVRATLSNPDNKLLPGTFVEVNCNMMDKNANIVMPQIAAFYDVGQTYVYKVVGNKAVKTKVVLGERDRENVVVLSGLNANETVVTAGQLNISDGATIKVAAENKK